MTRGSRLTSEDLEEIRERAEKATDGYWTADTETWPGNDNLQHWVSYIDNHGSDGLCAAARSDDATFIAHAREDIPKLLAEIERLNDRLRDVEILYNECSTELDSYYK